MKNFPVYILRVSWGNLWIWKKNQIKLLCPVSIEFHQKIRELIAVFSRLFLRYAFSLAPNRNGFGFKGPARLWFTRFQCKIELFFLIRWCSQLLLWPGLFLFFFKRLISAAIRNGNALMMQCGRITGRGVRTGTLSITQPMCIIKKSPTLGLSRIIAGWCRWSCAFCCLTGAKKRH